MSISVITIGIDPEYQLGPLTLSWHGITTALGIVLAVVLARRLAGEWALDRAAVVTAALVGGIAGLVGARVLYLLLEHPGDLLRPTQWFGNRGFAFSGAIIFTVAGLLVYLRRARLSVRYLDALAAAFPAGMALGRIGDVINGEHYGPASDLPWAVRYTHPEAGVPTVGIAYHSGGLYEVALALAMGAVVWPLRHRLTQPTALLWTVVGLYGAGRFAMFFFRSDTEPVALGLSAAQVLSLALMLAAAVGLAVAVRRPAPLTSRASRS